MKTRVWYNHINFKERWEKGQKWQMIKKEKNQEAEENRDQKLGEPQDDAD